MPSKKAKVSSKQKHAQITKAELQLTQDVRDLTKEVKKLKDLEFIRVFKHPWKFLGFSLLKGIMVGFGSVLGATVLVAFFIYLLAQISVVPFVGEFVQDVMHQVESSQTENPENGDKSFMEKYNEATN